MKNLPTTKKDSALVLKRAKNLLSITDKILAEKSTKELVDNDWMKKLWEWADENNIPNYIWVKDMLSEYYNGIPREISKLTNLTELCLFDNQLTELPKEIGNLINLTGLNMFANQLTELPKKIGNLINLTWIDLRDNKLTILPKEIGNLTNLITFWLSGNQLTELPKEIGNLTNLTNLYLRDNPKLILTKGQKEWVKKLEKKGCTLYIDDDLLTK